MKHSLRLSGLLCCHSCSYCTLHSGRFRILKLQTLIIREIRVRAWICSYQATSVWSTPPVLQDIYKQVLTSPSISASIACTPESNYSVTQGETVNDRQGKGLMISCIKLDLRSPHVHQLVLPTQETLWPNAPVFSLVGCSLHWVLLRDGRQPVFLGSILAPCPKQ